MANGKSRGPRPIGRPTIHWWTGAGPYDDPVLNALDHLRRYNFPIIGYDILPVTGFRLSREDRLAIDYLEDHGYTYHEGGTIPVAPPVPVVEVDVVNGIYTMNEGVAAFTDIFGEMGSIAKIDGVGLQRSRPLGQPMNYPDWCYLTPEAVALLNVEGGFSVAIDYVFDQMVDSLPSYSVPGIALGYSDASFSSVVHESTARISDGHLAGRYVNANDYVIDPGNPISYAEAFDALAGVDTTPPDATGSMVLTMGPQLRSYFVASPANGVESGTITFPHALGDTIYFGFMNDAHPNAGSGNYVNVTNRITVKRMRFYTPGQALGWVP